MTGEQLAQLILHSLNHASEVSSVALLEGEGAPDKPVVAVEAMDGAEFFVSIENA